jgi:multisubunit Na+/H+ antiporter MnhC subunit
MNFVLRLGLVVLAIAELVIGGWNLFAPEHFYANFPGVALTPPFAEHYARDFGGTTLGLGIILSVAVVLPRTVLVVPSLVGLAVFALPHAYFHLEHLHDASPFVAAFTLTAVLGEAALTVAMLVLALVRWRRDRAHSEDVVAVA